MKRTSTALLIPSLALAGLAAGMLPASAQSPAPAITVKSVPDPGAPAAAAGAPAAPATKSPTTAKTGGEVLPWANKPLAPMAALPDADLAAVEAAAQQCSGLFEAACRDLKTCAWVADVMLEDGTLVPSRCAARPPAPPKKAVKKSTPAKKAAVAAEDAPAAAPAVKAAVTRVEDAEPAAVQTKATEAPPPAAKKKEPEPEPQVEAAATPAPEPEPQKAEEKKPEKQAEAPIVVKPPAQPAPERQASPSPSFGSISGFGGGDAIVVTVPPSSE